MKEEELKRRKTLCVVVIFGKSWGFNRRLYTSKRYELEMISRFINRRPITTYYLMTHPQFIVPTEALNSYSTDQRADEYMHSGITSYPTILTAYVAYFLNKKISISLWVSYEKRWLINGYTRACDMRFNIAREA